jgi:hypothetical protein
MEVPTNKEDLLEFLRKFTIGHDAETGDYIGSGEEGGDDDGGDDDGGDDDGDDDGDGDGDGGDDDGGGDDDDDDTMEAASQEDFDALTARVEELEGVVETMQTEFADAINELKEGLTKKPEPEPAPRASKAKPAHKAAKKPAPKAPVGAAAKRAKFRR